MVDADFLREGAAFVMPVLYGKALCVHLRDFRKVVIVTEKPQDMMLFVEDLMILQKDNKKRTFFMASSPFSSNLQDRLL